MMTKPFLAESVSATQNNHENELDLRVYWNIFNKYKGRIIGLTLIIGLLTMLMTFSLQPIYRSTATLLIEMDKQNVISIEEVYGINPFNRDYYQTQIEILKSRQLAEKIVDRLNLMSHHLFNSKNQQEFSFNWRDWIFRESSKRPSIVPLTLEQKRKTIVNTILTNLSITPVRNSQLVKINFQSPDAKLAANVPNALANIYIESDLEAKLEMTKRATSWLTERIEGIRQKLSQSEQALQNYLERENLVNVMGVKSVSTRKIEETTSNLVSAHQRLGEAESVYRQVQALRGRSIKHFETIPAIFKNQLVQSLKKVELDAETKVSELSKRYGPKHPKMIAAQAEFNGARENSAQQIGRVISGLTKEYEVALANVQALERSMSQQEQQIQGINRKEYQLKVLEREVEVNRQLYDLFLTRFKETDVSQDVQALQSTVGRIVDPALVATIPYKPQKKRIVMISLVLGFLFAAMLAFLLEYLDNTIKNADDVEQKLGLALLGTLPKLKNRKKEEFKPQLMFLQEPKSHFAESARTIRTGMMLSTLDSPRKVFAVTSANAGEGKTTFAINQALALGQMGKTLLIDADMRRPSIAKIFGLEANTPGLSELIAGTRQFSECIQYIEEEKVEAEEKAEATEAKTEAKKIALSIIPSGIIPPNPLELLASSQFENLIARLEQKYDYIVIDSAPTLAVSDALVLAKYASSLVFVIKADATPHQMVRESIKRLQKIDVSILGVVLNQVNMQKLSQYYVNKYGYYHGSYGYYGGYYAQN